MYRCLLLAVVLCFPRVLTAQDPFEIHVYEYEPLKFRQFSLEAHLNLVTQGTTTLRNDGVCLYVSDSLQSFRFRILVTKRIPGGSNSAPLSIAISSIGRWCSILWLNARPAAQGQPAGGISNPRSFCVGRGRVSRLPSNITAKSRASTSGRTRSLKYINYSPAEI